MILNSWLSRLVRNLPVRRRHSFGKVVIKKTTDYESSPLLDPIEVGTLMAHRLAPLYANSDVTSVPLDEILLNVSEWRTRWFYPQQLLEAVRVAGRLSYGVELTFSPAPQNVDIGIFEGDIRWDHPSS